MFIDREIRKIAREGDLEDVDLLVDDVNSFVEDYRLFELKVYQSFKTRLEAEEYLDYIEEIHKEAVRIRTGENIRGSIGYQLAKDFIPFLK